MNENVIKKPDINEVNRISNANIQSLKIAAKEIKDLFNLATKKDRKD